jgi:hypothetical protein
MSFRSQHGAYKARAGILDIEAVPGLQGIRVASSALAKEPLANAMSLQFGTYMKCAKRSTVLTPMTDALQQLRARCPS